MALSKAAHGPPGNDATPGGEPRSQKRLGGRNTTIVPHAIDALTQIQRRCLQDAVNAALAATWDRRAAALEWARPLPHDFPGHRTPDQAREKWAELTQIAAACRARADLSRRHEGIDPDVDEALEVVA